MGTAHAATALSNMLDKKVTVSSLQVSWVDFQNVTDFIGGPENIIVGILIALQGDFQGKLMHLIDLESASTIIGAMLEEADVPVKDTFNEMEQSVLKEIGNIIVGAYVNSLAELLAIKIKNSTPFLSVDMANAIMSVPVAEFSQLADSALLIESKLSIEGINFSGCFSFVPNLDSFKLMLQRIGVE